MKVKAVYILILHEIDSFNMFFDSVAEAKNFIRTIFVDGYFTVDDINYYNSQSIRKITIGESLNK